MVILHADIKSAFFIETEGLTLVGGMNRFTRIKTLNPGLLGVSYQAEIREKIPLPSTR